MIDYIYQNKMWVSICLSLVLLTIGISITSIYLYDNKQCAIENDIYSGPTELVTLVNDELYVDIKGNVNNPGVYKLSTTNTVIDAINKAGGFTEEAYTNNINLSKMLTNEMVIYVFSTSDFKTSSVTSKTLTQSAQELSAQKSTELYIDEYIEDKNSVIQDSTTVNNSTSNNTSSSSSQEEVNVIPSIININNDPLEYLMSLAGIGESKASAIISYRQENGPFASIDEITNVSGIGDATYASIKAFITI